MWAPFLGDFGSDRALIALGPIVLGFAVGRLRSLATNFGSGRAFFALLQSVDNGAPVGLKWGSNGGKSWENYMKIIGTS